MLAEMIQTPHKNESGNVQQDQNIRNGDIENIEESVSEIKKEDAQGGETEEDKNWRRVRRANEEARKRAAEAEQEKTKALDQVRLLQEAIKTLVEKEKPAADGHENQDYDDDISAIVRKELEKYRLEEENRRAEQEIASLPEVLRQRIPDFDEVCSSENIEYLEFKFPELVIPFKYMPNGIQKWECVRNTIKKLIPNALGSNEKRKIEDNIAKPQSSSISGISHSSEPGTSPYLSDARKKENYKNMQRRIKGI